MINYNTSNNLDLVNYDNRTDSFYSFFDAFFGNNNTIKIDIEKNIIINTDYVYNENLEFDNLFEENIKKHIFNKCILSDINSEETVLTDEEYNFIEKKVNEKKDKSYLKKYMRYE